MEKKTVNEFVIVEDSLFYDTDAQNLQSLIRKYSKDFEIDFDKDISLTITVKQNPKLDGRILKIVLKDKIVDPQFDPAQIEIFEETA